MNQEEFNQQFSEAVRLEKEAQYIEAARLYLVLGNLLSDQNQLQDAMTLCEKALQCDPQSADAYNDIGRLWLLQRHFDPAISHFQHSIALRPNFPPVLNNLGVAYMHAGRAGEAIDSFQQLVELQPENLGATFQLAKLYHDEGSLGAALRYYEIVLASIKDNAEVYQNAAEVSLMLQDAGKALAYTSKAIELDPENSGLYVLQGRVLFFNAINDYSAAENAFKKAIQLDPENADACAYYGDLLIARNQKEAAWDMFEKALRINASHSHALLSLIRSRRYSNFDADEIQQALDLLEGDIPADDAVNLNFALGKAADQCAVYEKAWRFYENGNRLRRKKVSYDCDQDRKNFKSLMKAFSSKFFSGLEIFGSQDERPVFVVGMPRSGTTLVEQILDSHAAVTGLGELLTLRVLADNAQSSFNLESPYPRCIHELGQAQLASLAQAYIDENYHGVDPVTSRAVDKLPGNFMAIGFIRLLFPKAHIIHCKRNPVASCLSNYFTLYRSGHTYSYDLEELAFHYDLYRQIMDHWNKLFPGWIHELEYEALVTSPEKTIRNMLDYLGLDWDENCLAFHENRRAIRTASDGQVRKPIYKGSIDHWKHYEKYLGPLLKLK